MDTSRMNGGDIVASASGVALVLFMSAVNWFTVANDPTPTGQRNAWETFTAIDLVLFLVAIVAIGMAIARSAGVDLRALPLSPGVIVGGLGLLACALIVFRLVSAPDLQIHYAGEAPISVKERGGVVDRAVGIYLGLVASAGILVGGFLSTRRWGRGALRRR